MHTPQGTHSDDRLYAEERRHALVVLARQQGRVAVSEAADQFHVTQETVRRDLESLDRAGLLRRVHGGAVPLQALHLGDLPLADREQTASAEKDRIAAAALRFVPTRATAAVVLDAGTTTGRLAALLPVTTTLTIYTNSVPAAADLSARTTAAVHMLGGSIRGITQAAVGSTAVETLRRLRADVAFLGTNGLTVAHGLSTPDPDEAEVKRAMLSAATRVVVLADSRKVGAESLVSFGSLRHVDVLVTDEGISDADRETLTAQGIEVVTA